MGIKNYAGYIFISPTDAPDPINRTLIISSHGQDLEEDFQAPFPTLVSHCVSSGVCLLANVTDVFKGRVTPVEVGGLQGRQTNYKLTWFEHDPNHATLEREIKKVKDHKFDLLVFKDDRSMTITLKSVLTFLNVRNMKYPAIWSLWCRVDQSQIVDYSKTGHIPEAQGKNNKLVQTEVKKLTDQRILLNELQGNSKFKAKQTT
jgi:hypothetical protein